MKTKTNPIFFCAFSQAGRDPAHWHLNDETVEWFPGVVVAVGKKEGPYCPSLPANEPWNP